MRAMRMAVTSNAGMLALKMEHRSDLYPEEVAGASRQYARILCAQAQAFSRTQFLGTQALRRLKSPYAAREPHPPISTYLINRQTGIFYSSWHVTASRTADGGKYTVYNNAPYAGRMEGTKWMVKRPILQEAYKTTRLYRRRLLNAARMRGLRAQRGRGVASTE